MKGERYSTKSRACGGFSCIWMTAPNVGGDLLLRCMFLDACEEMKHSTCGEHNKKKHILACAARKILTITIKTVVAVVAMAIRRVCLFTAVCCNLVTKVRRLEGNTPK